MKQEPHFINYCTVGTSIWYSPPRVILILKVFHTYWAISLRTSLRVYQCSLS